MSMLTLGYWYDSHEEMVREIGEIVNVLKRNGFENFDEEAFIDLAKDTARHKSFERKLKGGAFERYARFEISSDGVHIVVNYRMGME